MNVFYIMIASPWEASPLHPVPGTAPVGGLQISCPKLNHCGNPSLFRYRHDEPKWKEPVLLERVPYPTWATAKGVGFKLWDPYNHQSRQHVLAYGREHKRHETIPTGKTLCTTQKGINWKSTSGPAERRFRPHGRSRPTLWIPPLKPLVKRRPQVNRNSKP